MFINGKTRKMKNMNQVMQNPHRNTCSCLHMADLGNKRFSSFVTTPLALTSSGSASDNKTSILVFRIRAYLTFQGRWTLRREKWMAGISSLASSISSITHECLRFQAKTEKNPSLVNNLKYIYSEKKKNTTVKSRDKDITRSPKFKLCSQETVEGCHIYGHPIQLCQQNNPAGHGASTFPTSTSILFLDMCQAWEKRKLSLFSSSCREINQLHL